MTNKAAKRRWRVILTVLTFLALAALIAASHKQILETVGNLGRVHAWALLLMIPIQALNYFAYTKMYQRFFKVIGEELPGRFMLKTVLELNFINNVFPSGGISGFSYFGLRLKTRGVGAGKATAVQVMRFAVIFISFQVLLFVGLLMLALAGHVSGLTILVAGSMATMLLVITFLAAYIIGSKARINAFFTFVTRAVNRVIQVARPKHPETINIARARGAFTEMHENYLLLKRKYRQLKAPLLYGLLANTTEIMTVYVVYIAFGRLVNPGAVIIAYGIANFAGLVSVLPGGVGIYEALMTAVLATAGVPPGLSIPVTVMYRILNMLIQLPPGYYFYHKTLSTKLENA